MLNLLLNMPVPWNLIAHNGSYGGQFTAIKRYSPKRNKKQTDFRKICWCMFVGCMNTLSNLPLIIYFAIYKIYFI